MIVSAFGTKRTQHNQDQKHGLSRGGGIRWSSVWWSALRSRGLGPLVVLEWTLGCTNADRNAEDRN